MNKIILSGNLCRNIETHQTNDGKTYTRNCVAVKRNFKNANGEYDSDFFNITLWGSQAEYISKYAQKGDKVLLSGRIQNNNYETENGMHYGMDIQVDSIELITNKKEQTTMGVEDIANEIFDNTVIEKDDEPVDEKKEKEPIPSIDDLLD